MGSGSSGRKRRGGAGWAYLLAGIVLIFASAQIFPALISALIVFMIGAGLLAIGARMFGMRMGLLCGCMCDGNCECRM